MDIIKWQDIYEVHVEEIDAQHKKLVALVNSMAEAMRFGKGKTVLGKVLKELVDYTVYHFQAEEGFFRKYDYPEYEKHKKMHDDLTAKALQLKQDYDEGKSVITAEVLTFLSSWLNKHIVEEDKRFGRFLNDKLGTAKAS